MSFITLICIEGVPYREWKFQLRDNVNAQVSRLKEKIFKARGFSQGSVLLYKYEILQDEKYLQDYRIPTGSVLHLVSWHPLRKFIVTTGENILMPASQLEEDSGSEELEIEVRKESDIIRLKDMVCKSGNIDYNDFELYETGDWETKEKNLVSSTVDNPVVYHLKWNVDFLEATIPLFIVFYEDHAFNVGRQFIILIRRESTVEEVKKKLLLQMKDCKSISFDDLGLNERDTSCIHLIYNNQEVLLNRRKLIHYGLQLTTKKEVTLHALPHSKNVDREAILCSQFGYIIKVPLQAYTIDEFKKELQSVTRDNLQPDKQGFPVDALDLDQIVSQFNKKGISDHDSAIFPLKWKTQNGILVRLVDLHTLIRTERDIVIDPDEQVSALVKGNEPPDPKQNILEFNHKVMNVKLQNENTLAAELTILNDLETVEFSTKEKGGIDIVNSLHCICNSFIA